MFFRILLWAVVFFFLARFIVRIISRVLKAWQDDRVQVQDQAPKKSEYQDVRDAKYTDVKDSDNATPPDQPAS